MTLLVVHIVYISQFNIQTRFLKFCTVSLQQDIYRYQVNVHYNITIKNPMVKL